MGGAKIAGIADIARDRRDRKSKTYPLINTDDTDQDCTAKDAKVAKEFEEFRGDYFETKRLTSMKKIRVAIPRYAAQRKDRWLAGGAGAQDLHGCECQTKD